MDEDLENQICFDFGEFSRWTYQKKEVVQKKKKKEEVTLYMISVLYRFLAFTYCNRLLYVVEL